MDNAAWCAAALVTHPEPMRGVQEDYVRAGADVIITNTLPTSRHVLEPAGLGDRFRELNTLAVELAKQAREHTMERQVHIAGSISTFPPATTTRCSRRRYRHGPTKRSWRRCWRRPGGPDRPGDTAGRGAGDLRRGDCGGDGLPAWAGFLYKRREDGAVVLSIAENTLAEALEEVPLSYVSIICVMYTLVEDAPALGGMMGAWSRPVGAYPHAGRFVTTNWQFTDEILPDDFAS